jgi:hypothetical protein
MSQQDFQSLPRVLPPLPLRLKVRTYRYSKPWLMEKVEGDIRFYRPDTTKEDGATLDASEFLKLVLDIRTVDDAHQFVNRYGAFCDKQEHWRSYVSLNSIRDLQKQLRVLAKSPPKALLSRLHGMFVVFSLVDGNLVALCQHQGPDFACLEQLALERLAGTEFGWCARHDCRKFFRCTSKHKRKYCSPECAHLIAVRTHRHKRG